MGEQLAAKVYWDRETGHISLITEHDVDGLDKFNFMIDMGPAMNLWRSHTNNEQRLIDVYPELTLEIEDNPYLTSLSDKLVDKLGQIDTTTTGQDDTTEAM